MRRREVWIEAVKNIAGLDLHIAFTVILRGWGLFAGALSIFLIPHFLSPIEQGYYYTFASILALQIFFELGIGQVVIQFVAHEAAHLHLNEQGYYEGEAETRARLAMLRSLLHRWYLAAAILFALIVCGIGVAFFQNGELPSRQWGAAWILLVGASAVNLFLSGKLAMVEGFTLVHNVAQLRLVQSIIGYILMWIGLAADAGLWVVACLPATAAIASSYWLRVGPAANVLTIRSSDPPLKPIRWVKDIFPLQWRIALSWISGYFSLQLFTPLVFRLGGAAEAGKLGLAMTVFNAISAVGISWVSAKAPNFSILIARGESRKLMLLFKAVSWRSLAITTVLSVLVAATSAVCIMLNVPIMQRVASLPVLVCLAWVTVVNCIIFASAIFMRAHRNEPMVVVSVVCSALTCVAAWLGSPLGSEAMMGGYALVSTLVGLPWTLWILRDYLALHNNAGAQAALPSRAAKIRTESP